MSEVARQYNLIGETLRQGVGDLLQGQAAGKALDMQAMKMGIEGEDRRHRAAMENKRFKMEAEKHDHVIKAHKRAAADPRVKLAERQAQTKMDLYDKDATRGTLGIDTLWEAERWEDKWASDVYEKTGIREHEGVFWQWKDGKPQRKLKHGELAENTDVAGIMLGSMDPLHHVRKQAEYEGVKLEQLIKDKGKFGDDEIWQVAKDAQQKTVEQLNAQIEDMEDKPIMYLNAQIDTLNSFMQNSGDPSMHEFSFKELSGKRAQLQAERIQYIKNQGGDPPTYEVKVFKEDGTLDYWKYVNKALSPMEDPDIQRVFALAKAQGRQVFLGEESPAIRDARQQKAAIAGSTPFNIGLLRANQQGGPEAAIEYTAQMFNAVNNAALGGDDITRAKRSMKSKVGIDFDGIIQDRWSGGGVPNIDELDEQITKKYNDGKLTDEEADTYFGLVDLLIEE